MTNKHHFFIFILLLFFIKNNSSNAQESLSSYTLYAEDNIPRTFAHNISMGEIGISAYSYFHINSLNPALLIKNNLTTFQTAFIGDYKYIQKDTNNAENFGGNLRYVSFVFPIITTKWSIHVGIAPLNSIYYNITSSLPENTASFRYNINGKGSLSHLYFSNGIKLFKDFSIGLRVSYVFGSVDESINTSLPSYNFGNDYSISYFIKNLYRGVEGGLGFAYEQKLSETYSINYGIIADVFSYINKNTTISTQRIDVNTTAYPLDTLQGTTHSIIKLPIKVGGGISFIKQNHYTIGTEMSVVEWTNPLSDVLKNTTFQKNIQWNIGGEYIPKYNSEFYLARIRYRAGFSFQKMPYLVGNQNVYEWASHFGFSFPVSIFSSIDLSFKIGERGKNEGMLIKETYFQIYFGATINDKWFIKRKYD
ncbi:MAG: hypothetical protein QM536_01705 [Chitinophagaceae bacterium]|nr:hypothetical protein [Chitinophagaceae bacterium]